MLGTGTGSEGFTVQLANALSARGIETVITRYPKQLEATPWMASLGKTGPPKNVDVVHLNAGFATGFFRYGIPSVVTGHGAFERSEYDRFKSLSQRLYHALLIRPGITTAVSKASAVTGVSQWVGDIYRQEYSARHVEVIHNWIAPEIFSAVQKKPSRKLLFAGRAAWQKGSHLLPALLELLGNDFELTCTLHQNEWKGEVPKNVHLIGPVAHAEMPELYRTHDALVVPSIAEGFCIAAAEAMACGLPVFGFRGHGLDDVLGPLVDVCGAKMFDMKAMAGNIQGVFEQQDVYVDVSRKSCHHATTSFTESNAVEKYISLYERTIIL